MSARVCHVPGCDREVYARGWCSAHWTRWQRKGDVCAHIPVGARPQTTPEICGRCEDIEWLLDAGTDPHDLARRILTRARPDTADSELRMQLRRHLTRHGRTDLLARYNMAVEVRAGVL